MAPAGQRGFALGSFVGGIFFVFRQRRLCFFLPPCQGGVGGVAFMGFPFQWGCLYPLVDYFYNPVCRTYTTDLHPEYAMMEYVGNMGPRGRPAAPPSSVGSPSFLSLQPLLPQSGSPSFLSRQPLLPQSGLTPPRRLNATAPCDTHEKSENHFLAILQKAYSIVIAGRRRPWPPGRRSEDRRNRKG